MFSIAICKFFFVYISSAGIEAQLIRWCPQLQKAFLPEAEKAACFYHLV